MEPVRLQKWLSQLGIASRREAEDWMSSGRLTVNGQPATQPGLKVDPDRDAIHLDGVLLPARRPEPVYYMFCKPDGVLTARRDPRHRPTLYDLPALKKVPTLVFPVGRLDFHTEGLLLLSNDGEWVNRLMHPRYKVPRGYYAMVPERLSPTQEARIRQGLPLEDGPTLPAELRYLPKHQAGAGAWYEIQVREGRNRLVRRLFAAVGSEVIRLIRFAYGEVRLPKDLAPGRLRPLYHDELARLCRSVGLEDRI